MADCDIEVTYLRATDQTSNTLEIGRPWGEAEMVVTLTYDDHPTSSIEKKLTNDHHEECVQLCTDMNQITTELIASAKTFSGMTNNSLKDVIKGLYGVKPLRGQTLSSQLSGICTGFLRVLRGHDRTQLGDLKNRLETKIMRLEKLHEEYIEHVREALEATAVSLILMFELIDQTQPAKLDKTRLVDVARKLKRMNWYLTGIDSHLHVVIETAIEGKTSLHKKSHYIIKQIQTVFIENDVKFKQQTENVPSLLGAHARGLNKRDLQRLRTSQRSRTSNRPLRDRRIELGRRMIQHQASPPGHKHKCRKCGFVCLHRNSRPVRRSAWLWFRNANSVQTYTGECDLECAHEHECQRGYAQIEYQFIAKGKSSCFRAYVWLFLLVVPLMCAFLSYVMARRSA